MNGNSALSRISIPSATNRFFHEFPCSKPHAAPRIGERFTLYEQTLSERSASVTLMRAPASALKMARSGALTTAHLSQILGLIRLEILIVKEVHLVALPLYVSCGC